MSTACSALPLPRPSTGPGSRVPAGSRRRSCSVAVPGVRSATWSRTATSSVRPAGASCPRSGIWTRLVRRRPARPRARQTQPDARRQRQRQQPGPRAPPHRPVAGGFAGHDGGCGSAWLSSSTYSALRHRSLPVMWIHLPSGSCVTRPGHQRHGNVRYSIIEMCSPPGRASTGHRGLQMGYGALFRRRLAAAHRYSARVPIRSCAVPRSPVDHAGLASSMTPTDALCYR